MPGAFEGETVTRRRFMNVVAQGVGAGRRAAFTLPALGFALGPLFSREPFDWQPVGPPATSSSSTYATKVITIVQGIGEAGKTIAYMRKRDPAIDTEPEDQYNQYIALSSRCMHLGCPVRYVAAAERFICPCHGGVYDFRGSSPAVLRSVRSTASTPAYHRRPGRGRTALLGELRAAPVLAA